MAGRRLVFMPLAAKARQAFVNARHEAALEALFELDKLIQSHPESGTGTSRKGRFSLKTLISVHQNAFLCEVVYSFTDRAISWQNFAWMDSGESRNP